jgi:TolA-binding protein
MTGVRHRREGDEDLVVSARRRPLDEAERQELDAALDADPALRLAHDVGRAFDDVAFVQPGDEALIARAVDRTLGIGNRRAAAWRWRTAAAVAAGFLLAVGGAATAYRAGIGPLARRQPAVETHPVAPPAPPARSRARAGGSSQAPSAVPLTAPVPPEPPAGASAPVGPGAAPTELDPVSDPPVAPASHALHALNDGRSSARPSARGVLSRQRPAVEPAALEPSPVASTGSSDGNVTPAELFRRAGAARRAGALAEAAAVYRDLQARFPAAEEARVSHVSLGKLLLTMGRPQEAEHHFAAYLTGGAGALAAEAAFGRAQSFERLGLAREEREVWLGLLRDHPESVYAGAARKRLAALELTGR